jgi:hypothetical protein
VTDHTAETAADALIEAMVARMGLYLENAERCLDQLDDQHIWFRTQPSDNAIGNLVLHTAGNLDQIVNRVEGISDVRDRPAEFAANGGLSKEVLTRMLRRSISECCRIMRSLPHHRYSDPYRIQGTDTTIAYAMIMAVSHFSLHLGQMQFVAKSLLRERYQEAPRRAPK